VADASARSTRTRSAGASSCFVCHCHLREGLEGHTETREIERPPPSRNRTALGQVVCDPSEAYGAGAGLKLERLLVERKRARSRRRGERRGHVPSPRGTREISNQLARSWPGGGSSDLSPPIGSHQVISTPGHAEGVSTARPVNALGLVTRPGPSPKPAPQPKSYGKQASFLCADSS